MASKVTIDASASSKPKPSAAAPIEPLKNDAAQIYTHVHPVVVLSLYVFSFKSIVADPVPALLNILAPLAVLQIAYVAICLPPTGETPKVKKTKPGEKKKQASGKLESGVNGTIVVCKSISGSDGCTDNYVACFPLAPPYRTRIDASTHCDARSLRRTGYHAPLTHAPVRRSHCAA